MDVLVACEFSGIVRDAFAARGHNAWSCDLLPTETSGQHILGDALEAARSHKWDLMIAHPPCTYLSRAGARWWNAPGRKELRDAAVEFVRDLMNVDVPRIAIENPAGALTKRIRPPDQYIHPYWFGDDVKKTTGLWLTGLPLLTPTGYIEGVLHCCGKPLANDDKYGCPNCCGEKKAVRIYGNQLPSGQDRTPDSKDQWKRRSRFHPGVAAAMAQQWGAL